MERLTVEQLQEQRLWAMTVYRLGMSGNRAGLHAELLRQESVLFELIRNAAGMEDHR